MLRNLTNVRLKPSSQSMPLHQPSNCPSLTSGGRREQFHWTPTTTTWRRRVPGEITSSPVESWEPARRYKTWKNEQFSTITNVTNIQTIRGRIPPTREEPARRETAGEGKEWKQEREERARASQVVEYRDAEGNCATWLGGPGEHPPAHLRKLFPPYYTPSRITSKNPFSTGHLPLEEVRGRLKERLGAR